MSDMLQIAQSGALAYSRALDVVADNVANANTPGYVRRTVSLSPAPSSGNGPLSTDPIGGNGVRLTSVNRAVDALQMDTLRRAEGDVAGLDAAGRWLRVTQSTLTGPASIDESYGAFIDSLAQLTTDPTDLSQRQMFLMRADALADRFQQSAAELDTLQSNLRDEARGEAASLTALAQDLATLNGQIRRAGKGSSTQASLLDQQDKILAQMSTIVAIDVRYDQLGQASVRIPDSGGPVLVDGNESRYARIAETGAGFELRIGPKGDDEIAPTGNGTLSGLSAAAQKISEAQGRLDELATRLVADFNAAHENGVDLNGDDGKPLFSILSPQVSADAANGGDARVSATLAPGATLDDMRLIFDGTDWTLADASSNSVSGPMPLTLNGVTVDAAAPGVAGDVYRIRPARPAAAIAVNQLAPEELALSTRWQTAAAQTNAGDAHIEVKLDGTASNAGTPPFTLSVAPDGSLELYDSSATPPLAPIATGPAGSDWLQGDGFAVRLTGTPAPGDSFRIEHAGPNEANNGNAQQLLALRDRSGAGGTFGNALDSLRSTITTSLSETSNRRDLAVARRDGAAEALQQSSGVDLNTEAADMVRLQQAFQANARIIQVSREIFDAILTATR